MLCSVLSVVKTHQADSLPSFHLLLATHGAGGKPKQGQRLRLPTSYFIPLNHHLGSPPILQPHKQDGAIKEVRNLKGFSLLPKTATAESPRGGLPRGPRHAGSQPLSSSSRHTPTVPAQLSEHPARHDQKGRAVISGEESALFSPAYFCCRRLPVPVTSQTSLGAAVTAPSACYSAVRHTLSCYQLPTFCWLLKTLLAQLHTPDFHYAVLGTKKMSV